MEVYLKNCRIYREGRITLSDVYIGNGVYLPVTSFDRDIPVVSAQNLLIAPSFCDLHVHLREPGFSYKETIESGTRAAAKGGFTTISAMPNLNPVPDSLESLRIELELIGKQAVIEVLPYAAITRGEKGLELADIQDMAELCCGYSDDGNGVQSEEIMKSAMQAIAKTGRFLAAHVEDNSYVMPNGTLHPGIASRRFIQQVIPPEAEYIQLRRDMKLVEETGVRYHLCHISTKESVDIIRKAKQSGLQVTCEVTPHHFSFSDGDIIEDSGRFKMNPPLRGEEDRNAILTGLSDGTIDVIATDHAPHSKQEKTGGLSLSAFGTVGLETAFAAANTFLVKTGIVSPERLFYLMCDKPREILNRKTAEGFVLLDTEWEETVDPKSFLSLGSSTPFEGQKLKGKVVMTVCNGKTIYIDGGYAGEQAEKAGV